MIAVAYNIDQRSEISRRISGPAHFNTSISYCVLERRGGGISTLPILEYVSPSRTETRLFNAYAQSLGSSMRLFYNRIRFLGRRVHRFPHDNPTVELMRRVQIERAELFRGRNSVASNPYSWRHR